MTCIAVIKDTDGKLVFAADRRISQTNMVWYQAGPAQKIVKRDGIIFAGSGDGYVSDLIGEIMPIPLKHPTQSLLEYLHLDFTTELTRFLRDRGLMDKDEFRLAGTTEINSEHEIFACLLMGIEGQLFELQLTQQRILIDRMNVPHTGGCGGPYAIGALLALDKSKLSAQDKLIKALTIAAALSPACDTNIDIIKED